MRRVFGVFVAFAALTVPAGSLPARGATVAITRSSIIDFAYRGTLSGTEAVHTSNTDADLSLQYVTTIPNGDFEQGLKHWSTDGKIEQPANTRTRNAYTGQAARISSKDNTVGGDSYITSDAFVPVSSKLTYQAKKTTSNGIYQSAFKAELLKEDGTLLENVTPKDMSMTWQQFTVDLSKYIGQPVRIRFYGGTQNKGYAYGAIVDQVEGGIAPRYAATGTWTTADIIKPVNATGWAKIDADVPTPAGTGRYVRRSHQRQQGDTGVQRTCRGR